MFLKQSKRKDGRNYLALVRSVRDRKTKSSRTVTVESLGYEDELRKIYDDPIAHFKAEALRRTNDEKDQSQPILLKINPKATLKVNDDNRKNLGFVVLSQIFHNLELDQFLLTKQRYTGFAYNALSITKLLIYSQLLWPGSKKKAWDNRDLFFEPFKCSLDDVYRCMSFLSRFNQELPLYLHQRIVQKYGRKTDLVYYDVTNYYFEIDKPDEMRKKGVSKEKRKTPIIQMGLFMDTNGIPICYRLFPGNMPDCSTVIPLLSTIQRQYELGRVIVVADRGVISGDVIHYAKSAENGYIFSYSIRGADKEFKQYVLNQEGYMDAQGKSVWPDEDSDEPCAYKIKSRLFPREIRVTMADGKKKKRIVDEKQVVFYSKKYADKAKKEREEAIAKARELVACPANFNHSNAYGAAKYVQNLKFDKKSGEILQNTGDFLLLDEEKIREEELLDGYYALVTSEHLMSNQELINAYRGLWQIEETFRITKSDLKTRPVFLSRLERIEAHFLICFVALVIGRILEKSLQDKYSIHRLMESLRDASGSFTEENVYVFNYLDQVLLDIGNKHDIDLRLKYRRIGEIRELIGKTKK